MTFTPESPTAPGFYLWKKRLDSPVHHLYEATDLADLDEWRKLGGVWCMLVLAEDTVPKVEVERAYKEAWDKGFQAPIELEMSHVVSYANEDWLNSRAKRAMEGTL